MSNVTVNKVGMDIVDIEVRQKGKASTDMFFQNPILDYTRDYVIGVSELQVPLASEPMFSVNPENDIILRIQARDPLWDVNNVGVNMGPNSMFSLTRNMVSSAGSFFQGLAQFGADWNGRFAGAGNVRSVQFRTTSGGRLRIAGTPDFWINHWIEFSRYGQELLGLERRFIHFTQDALPGGGNPIEVAEGMLTYGGLTDRGNLNGLFIVQDVVALQALGQILEYVSPHEVLSRLEHRMRIEIDADLSVPANILLENEIQKVHYNIGSFAFPTDVEQELSTTAQVATDSFLKERLLTGPLIVKSKKEPTTDWYRLLATANVQNMRLHIFIVRREYNQVTRKWSLVRNELNIRDQDTWEATLKFVQTF